MRNERGQVGTGLLVAVGVVAAVVVVMLVGVFGVGWFRRSTADFRGKTEAIERTKANADFRISAYNEFFDLCNGVRSSEERLAIARDAVRDFKGTDQETTAIANLNAIRSQRVNLINEYNAKASRQFTEGQFRAASLPYRIDTEQEPTLCG